MDQTQKIQDTPGIVLSDIVPEAGIKIFRIQFALMNAHEPGVRSGLDIEELHDMRVAARKLRSAMSDFRPFFQPKIPKKYIKNLRSTGQILGAVRDLDVFLAKAKVDLENRSDLNYTDLCPFFDFCNELRNTHRERMVRYLDGVEYSEFTQEFSHFINQPEVTAKGYDPETREKLSLQFWIPHILRQRLAQVSDFNQVIENASLESLHSLRIKIKRLRYMIEFFREIIGEKADQVILEMKNVQDHLGNLNDVRVAIELIDGYLKSIPMDRTRNTLEELEKVSQFLTLKENQKDLLVTEIPSLWKEFFASGVDGKLADLVANTFLEN